MSNFKQYTYDQLSILYEHLLTQPLGRGSYPGDTDHFLLDFTIAIREELRSRDKKEQ
jgi:hypothetical protein